MIGMPNINQYFKIAMGYPVAKLQDVIRGKDHSIPAIAAMAAFEIKGPLEIAAKAQQAAQKQSSISVRDKLAQEGEEKGGMLPDDIMLAMQQQQQGSLPENTGIGQLPAPNMQTMSAANGGIIAFDDGGEVPGYAGDEGSFVSSAGNFFNKLMPQEYDEGTKQRLNAIDNERRAYYKQLYDIAGPSGRGAKTPDQQMAADKLKQRIDQLDKDFMSTKFGKTKTKAEGEKPRVSDANEARISKPYPSNAKPKAVDPTAGQAVTDANANPFYIPPDAIPAEKPTTPPVEKRTGIAAIASPQTGRPGGKSDLDAALEASSRLGGSAESDYKAKLANYGNEATAVMNKLALEREQGKPTGQAYSGLEASLKKDEAAVAGKEQRNLQMALVNAGLAIAGGTSRYALENIGKGAMVGTKQYMEGVDKLEAAAKERQKAMAMIEQERRAEARGDWKDKNEFAAKRAEFELNAKKFGVEGVGKIFEVGKRSATDLYNTMSTNASRERIGQEQNKTELLKADKMAAAYSQRMNDPMTLKKAAMDDALQAWQAEQKDKTFMLLKPEQKALRQRQIYERIFGSYGLASPFGGGAAPAGGAPAGGAQRPPLSQRTDLFQ